MRSGSAIATLPTTTATAGADDTVTTRIIRRPVVLLVVVGAAALAVATTGAAVLSKNELLFASGETKIVAASGDGTTEFAASEPFSKSNSNNDSVGVTVAVPATAAPVGVPEDDPSSTINNNNDIDETDPSGSSHQAEQSKLSPPAATKQKEQSHPQEQQHQTTTTIRGLKNGTAYTIHRSPHPEIAVQQIRNYNNATGLMVQVHVAHHRGWGSPLCNFVSSLKDHPLQPGVTTPSYACHGVTPRDDIDPADKAEWGLVNSKHRIPWSADETTLNIRRVRKYFHMVEHEYAELPRNGRALADGDWENPNLLSVLVTRDPVDQLLDELQFGAKKKEYAAIVADEALLRQFAETENSVLDNFVLRILSGDANCCASGNATDTDLRQDVEAAKALIRRFSVVLDYACLNEGMTALADLFNYTLKKPLKPSTITISSDDDDEAATNAAVARLGNRRDVYEYLLEKNKYDIELYRWSKTVSLVDCGSLTRRR